VRWCTESPLIERHEGHHVSFRRSGEHRILWHTASPSSAAVMNTCFTSFCIWPCITAEGVQSCSAMAQKGRGGITIVILVFLLFSFSSLSPLSAPLSFSFRSREGGKERTADHVKGYRVAQGQPPALTPATSAVKWLGPLRCSKGLGKLGLPTSLLLAHHASHASMGYRRCIQQAPRWLGVCQSLGFEGETNLTSQSRLEQLEQGMK
jgi:hypothetical protein